MTDLSVVSILWPRGRGQDFVGGIMRERQLVPVALDIFMDVGDSLYNVAEENRA